jgi:tol-pal system protein YbgF
MTRRLFFLAHLLLALPVALQVRADPGPIQPMRVAQADTRSPGVVQLMNQIETMNADLNRLRGQLEVVNNSLENAQRRQRDMYLDLDTRLRRLEGGAEGGAKADGKAGADLESRVKKLETDHGGESKHDQQLLDLETRLRKLEQQAGAVAPPAVPAAAAPGATVTAPTPPTPPTVARPTVPAAGGVAPSAAVTTSEAAARRAYDSAMALYRANDFQGAISAFDSFLKRYPRDPLAPNAQYWIGDAWFNLRDFRAAAAAQQAMITAYPDSPKLPDAMLNLSSAQIALGDNVTARKTLEDLIARYPQTDAAERAKQRLARLRQ